MENRKSPVETQPLGHFTRSEDWKEVKRKWIKNADPIDSFATHYLKEEEEEKVKREAYSFYKGIKIDNNESYVTMMQYGKLISAYY